MTKSDTPKDGDFASYLEGMASRPPRPSDAEPTVGENNGDPVEVPRQTIQQVLVDGEEPTEEVLEEWNALENAPDVSDEELARQALEAGGEDGDPNTPE